MAVDLIGEGIDDAGVHALCLMTDPAERQAVVLLGIAAPEEVTGVFGIVEDGVLRDITARSLVEEGIAELPCVNTGREAHRHQTGGNDQTAKYIVFLNSLHNRYSVI